MPCRIGRDKKRYREQFYEDFAGAEKHSDSGGESAKTLNDRIGITMLALCVLTCKLPSVRIWSLNLPSLRQYKIGH